MGNKNRTNANNVGTKYVEIIRTRKNIIKNNAKIGLNIMKNEMRLGEKIYNIDETPITCIV